MRSVLLAIWLCLSTALPAFAQSQRALAEFLEHERKGVEAARAGKYAEALAAFQQCHGVVARDGRSAYNIACVHALDQKLDLAFEWLDKAADYGFGVDDEDLKLLETEDKDIGVLRPDARFAALVTKIKTQRKRALDFAAQPVAYIPDALKGTETLPLLVVLHDAGETKDGAFANGPWKRLADELGSALLIPSARRPLEPDPAKGMRWFDWMFNFESSAFAVERSVSDAVSAFRKEHKLDPARVYIVGVGQGGMVAFDIAVSLPGLYKGAVVYGSAIHAGLVGAKGANAGKMGLRAKVLLGNAQNFALDDGPAQLDTVTKSFESAFTTWKVAGKVERFERKSDDPEQCYKLISAALRAFATPVEAAATPTDGGGTKQ